MMESKYALTSKIPVKTNGMAIGVNERINAFSAKRKLCNLGNSSENVNLSKIPKHNPATVPKINSTAGNGKNENASPSSSSGKLSLQQQRQLLPVYNCRQRVLQEVHKADTLLLMGETGSGKTTQIPQFLLSAGYGHHGVIGVTQPRRVAAITIAKRVALEQGCRLGETVGYTVRFEDCTSSQTRIRFVTDGSLVREAIADRLLRHYSVIMLDEAHERTINTDILFGIVKDAQRQRRMRGLLPLKVIITSATMDIDNFSRYFGVPGMYLEGRTYPVRVLHAKKPQPDYIQAVLATLRNIHKDTPYSHEVLVFLTGQEEIETLAHQIRQLAKVNGANNMGVRVFPLYAQLPQNKQLECFLPSPPNARKIILATNIAETSITIPGIRCVVDCGFVKRRLYNPSTGLDMLRVVRISQAQAWQRCGRAGRNAPGTCYRTYTHGEMSTFDLMPKPEILCSNISSTVLQLLALNIDCRTFDFIDKPSPEAIEEAYCKLATLGAIVSSNKPELTALGRQMAKFPLDPQYGKLLLSAPSFGCMEEMLSLVAVLSGENVFVSSVEKRERAALAHAKFHSKHGDHLTLLNVYSAFQKTEKIKLWCHDNFLNSRNLLYAREVRKQLLEIVKRLNLQVNSCGNNQDLVRKCLITGLFENIAELQRDNSYLTVSGRQRAKIHPSSIFHGQYKPEYIVFTEMVFVERNYLRQVTEICPDWIAEVIPNYAHLHKIRNLSFTK